MPTTKRRKSETKRRDRSIGAEIIAGLEEAIAYERGEDEGVVFRAAPITARRAVAEPAPAYSARAVASLRERLHLSQSVFAQVVNVTPRTVQSWEQGTRAPEAAALRLLQLLDEAPGAVLGVARYAERKPRSARRRETRRAASRGS